RLFLTSATGIRNGMPAVLRAYALRRAREALVPDAGVVALASALADDDSDALAAAVLAASATAATPALAASKPALAAAAMFDSAASAACLAARDMESKAEVAVASEFLTN